MKMAFKIFLRDLRRLRKNCIAMVVFVGICVIPSLYALFIVYANMDPYANTGNIQVAVVNMDAGVTDERVGYLDAGDAVEEKLRDNDQLGWVFTEEDQAIEGVKSGEYYAAIIIPETFSADLVSVFSNDIHPAEIVFYSNEKKNTIAPKITGTGVSTLQQGINDEFVGTVSETAASLLQDKIREVDGDLETSSAKLRESIRKTEEQAEAFEALVQDFHALIPKADRVVQDGKDDLALAGEALENAKENGQKIETKLTADWESINDFSTKIRSEISDAGQKLSDLNVAAGADIGTINSKVSELDDAFNRKADPIVSRVKAIQEENAQVIDLLTELDEALLDAGLGNGTVHDVLEDLKEDNERHAQILSLLESASAGARDLYSASSAAYSALNGDITDGQSKLQSALNDFDTSVMTDAGAAFGQVSSASGNLQGLMETAQTDLTSLAGLLDDLDGILHDTDAALADTQEVLDQIQAQLSQAEADLNAIESMQVYTDLKSAAGDIDAEQVGRFMSSPVTIEREALYPVANYGTGMTPFFTNLAIWIGGIVLINVYKTEVDEDEKLHGFSITQAYLGRWLLFVVTGLIQAVIVCAGDLLLLGIQCERPGLFVLSGMWTSFIYMNIIYALAITFKHIGKALSVLLIILQIPGASGTYPIELTPLFFRNLHPFLPFTYGINAMREAIAGVYPYHYIQNMLMLLIFLPAALVIGLALRPLCLNLNHMVDKRLVESDLMACEHIERRKERKNLIMGARILLADQEMRARIKKRIDRFEQRYQKTVRRSFLLIVIIPAVFLILMFLIPAKMVFLTLWIVSMLAVVLFLIIMEYFRDHLDRQKRISEMTQDELIESIRSKNKEHGES